MAEELFINKNQDAVEIYEELESKIEALICSEDLFITNLANFTAALKQTFDKFSWVGFYFVQNGKLFLGPFQGKVACNIINAGSGVCGKAFAEGRTVIVPDVSKFSGHIVCDSESRSEIVVPLIKDNIIYGVLDIDSTQLGAFSDIDKINLEILCNMLMKKLDFHKFHLS